ncbi:MAG: GGDEF domain-containing protein [Mariprofundus sp.]
MNTVVLSLLSLLQSRLVILMSSILCLSLLNLILWLLLRKQMIQPIIELQQLARRIGNAEDHSINILAGRRDEIGSISRVLLATEDEVERQQQELRALTERMDNDRRRDPLTGLYNRRHLYLEGPNQFVMAHRLGFDISVMMIDLDLFKRINDTYGHTAGDKVLVEVAATLLKNSRPYDLLIRFGGEEFTMVLINCDREQAGQIAQRIREDIEALQINYEDSGRIAVTCSIGVCSGKDMDTEQMILIADEAVYRAKDAGRNCVEHGSFALAS